MASTRTQIATNEAERAADNGNREQYPCKFVWEIADFRIFERFEQRVNAGEPLTERQVAWYIKRLNFRNIVIPAELIHKAHVQAVA